MSPSGEDLRVVLDESLTHPAIERLLQSHLDSVQDYSPPESIHALDLSRLRVPGISFYCGWIGNDLAGVGALRELDPTHGEIKSMKTDLGFLRQGVGARILETILAEARSRAYDRVSLETGSHDFFEPARALYRRFGFELCEPFADYALDPYSVFMTRRP